MGKSRETKNGGCRISSDKRAWLGRMEDVGYILESQSQHYRKAVVGGGGTGMTMRRLSWPMGGRGAGSQDGELGAVQLGHYHLNVQLETPGIRKAVGMLAHEA